MDIYIKPMEKVQMVGRKIIYLSDVAEVYAGDSCQGALEKASCISSAGEYREYVLDFRIGIGTGDYCIIPKSNGVQRRGVRHLAFLRTLSQKRK